jgi:hypothetical protein
MTLEPSSSLVDECGWDIGATAREDPQAVEVE